MHKAGTSRDDSGDDSETGSLTKPKIRKMRKSTKHRRAKIANIDEEVTCEVCGDKFTYRKFDEHKKTEKHRLAKRDYKKPETLPEVFMAGAVPGPSSLEVEKPKFEKEKYKVRFDVRLSEQNQKYQNTLTAFLALRFCFKNENKDMKISMNNFRWKDFGDIVIEIVSSDTTKIYALQCKKIQNNHDIPIPVVIAENGKLSIKKQCEILLTLRKEPNYGTTYFKLFTASNLIMDNDMEFSYNDTIVDKWRSSTNKDTWRDRKLVVALYKKACPINTTDDPDNICIFKILNHKDENLDKDLCKFSMYINQNKTGTLQYQIRTMIEDKFHVKRDISNDLAKYMGDYFQTHRLHRHKYIMTKKDILLKIAELVLEPYILFPESTTEGRSIQTWDLVVQKFDLTIIKNEIDIVNKIYSSLNSALKSKICPNMDTSTKSLKIDKNDVQDEMVRSEMFDGFPGFTREVSLAFLYITLWKTGLAPLVLTVDDESNLLIIIKIISFLKSENISLNFILITNLEIHPSYFPDHLKIFTSLDDLKKSDEELLKSLLDKIEIPVFECKVSLGEIIDRNVDFLEKVAPDAFLNMVLEEFSFSNYSVPITGGIVDNTLVFEDEMVDKLKKYFEKDLHLSYVVDVKGNPTRIEVPPDI